MFTCYEESALTLLTKWSNSARELVESYTSFRAPEWLNQSIFASWCFGGKENIEIDVQIGQTMEALGMLAKPQTAAFLEADEPSNDWVRKVDEVQLINDGMLARRVGNIQAYLISLTGRYPKQFAHLMNEIGKRWVIKVGAWSKARSRK